MTYPFFAYIARMRYIGRWGLMRNTEPENIQEHSHMVAVLAHALAVIRRDRFGGTVDPGRVTAAALYHDASGALQKQSGFLYFGVQRLRLLGADFFFTGGSVPCHDRARKLRIRFEERTCQCRYILLLH